MPAGGEEEPDDVVFDKEKTQKAKEKKESEQAQRAQREVEFAELRAQRAEQRAQARAVALEKRAEEEFLRLNKRTWNQVKAALEYLGRPTVHHTSPAPEVAAAVLKEGIAWYKKVQLSTHPDRKLTSKLGDKFPDAEQQKNSADAESLRLGKH